MLIEVTLTSGRTLTIYTEFIAWFAPDDKHPTEYTEVNMATGARMTLNESYNEFSTRMQKGQTDQIS